MALLCALPMTVSCGNKGLNIEPNPTNVTATEPVKKEEVKETEPPAKETEEPVKEEPKETEPPEPEVAPYVPQSNVTDWTLYAAPPKTAEAYDPNIQNRELNVHGAAISDGDYCVLYGDCAVGATVTATNANGSYSVVSEGGCFALRFLNPGNSVTLEVTQSANGTQIGDALSWTGTVVKPQYGSDWGVWIGGENQGFYQKMIPDFTHTNLMKKPTLDSVKNRYTDRVNKLKTVGDGCELVVVLVPASMTVYPELVPAEVATPAEGESRFDQLAQVLTESGVKVIDMRAAYAERKNDSLPLYFNYDSHWTDYGAYLAYVELYSYIAEKYPAATPRTFADFHWNWNYYTRGDIPWYFDLDQGGKIYEYTFERTLNFDAVPVIQKMTRYQEPGYSLAYPMFTSTITDGGNYDMGNPDLPDIMVMRNSYGSYMFDLMIERSNKSYMLPSFSYTFNFAQIKKNDPDYLIYILSEWDFANIIDN